MNKPRLPHKLLPPALQDQLRAAARIDPDKPPGESFWRTREIDFLVSRYKRLFPKFFRR